MKILIPTKSAPSVATCSWLNALAMHAQVNLRLISVGQVRAEAARPEGVGPAVTVEVVHRDGDIVESILEEASGFNPTLIMLATRGLRGTVATLRGSIASGLVERASHPLALLGPHCRPTEALSGIVLPLDGSAYASRAISAISTMARELHLQVTLLQAIQPAHGPSASAQGELAKDFLEASYLRWVAAELKDRDIQWEVAHGNPAEAIPDFLAAKPGCVAAMTSHGHSGWRRKLFGSVAEAVVAASTVPVVVIPPAWGSA